MEYLNINVDKEIPSSNQVDKNEEKTTEIIWTI